MELVDHLETLRAEGMLLADSAEATGFDATVPTCPEWTVRDLVRHIGFIHRWARSHLVAEREVAEPEQEFATHPADDGALLGWFREGHAELLQALEAADPDGDYPTFVRGVTGVRFWARRQAHETTIHRVDAQNVTGLVSPSTPEFAADGINEIFDTFYARRPNRVTSAEPYSFVLVSTDVPDAWRVTVDAEGPSVSGEAGEGGSRVYGTAFDLYLLMWNRRSLDGLETQGSMEGLKQWREKAHVRWS